MIQSNTIVVLGYMLHTNETLLMIDLIGSANFATQASSLLGTHLYRDVNG